jgi:predicted dehydrogenase
VNAVRIGILGAARIAPVAVILPAQRLPEVKVTAVAARDPARARDFANRHRIGRVHPSYEALLADPEVDAVYNPLPNALHARWTLAALKAGKHVLCEKPFTANAAEARQVAEAAARSGRVVMEAFHYRYHPLAERMREVITGGEIGAVQRVETWLCFPLPLFSDIRYRYDLAGGATMDAGCYAVHLARLLGGGEPEVLSATPKLLGRSTDVDRAMRAELRFPSGATGRVTCSMWSSTLLRIAARVTGDSGRLDVFNPIMPQKLHRLTVRSRTGTRRETSSRRPSYECQLEAFTAAILRGAPVLTSPEDAVANMSVIDAIYTRAGMRLRGAS